MRFLTFFFLITSFCALSQVEIDNKIVFDSVHNIKNLEIPSDSLEATTYSSIRNSHEVFAVGNLNNNEIQIDLEVDISEYNIGLIVIFKPTQTNTGPVQVQVDNLPLTDLLKYGNHPLKEGDITANVMYQMFYDGTNFQLLNVHDRSCPSNTIEVNENL